MVRLKEEETPLTESRAKRSRPKSSLDYKTDPTEQKLYADTTRGSQNQMQNQPEQEQRANTPGQKYPTRARGSGGIPETKLPPLSKLEDLDGMSEEEIAQALQENPHLANLAAEQAGTPRRQRKTEALDRLDMLKEQGVPYQQWAIILFVLGIAFYQLYRTVKQPVATGKTTNKAPTGKKSKKVKAAKSSNTTTERKFSVKSDDEVVAALEGSVGKSTAPPKKPGAAGKKKKKKAAKPSAKTTTTPPRHQARWPPHQRKRLLLRIPR